MAEIGKLGFGLMRLPKQGMRMDIEQSKKMVDLFMGAGFNYFDTAYVYIGSEVAAKQILVDRYPRESFYLASKLNCMIPSPSASIPKRQLQKSLERTGTGYFDYYLLHGIMNGNVNRYERYKIWEYAQEQKVKGKIRHVGFSFHAGPDLLDRILTEHPETEFVQLQLNYADWESPTVYGRQNYEVARKHGKPIIVMEPVKGGKLASPPAAVQKLFTSCDPGASPASWAIRFAASLEGVLTVLSGMSTIAQMEDNLSFMRDFHPLSEKEREVIRQAQKLIGKASGIDCTGCGYCMPGCPKKIAIPSVFRAANDALSGNQERGQKAYQEALAGHGSPKECLRCGKCEQMCPQHLPIIADLEKSADMFSAKDAS